MMLRQVIDNSSIIRKMVKNNFYLKLWFLHIIPICVNSKIFQHYFPSHASTVIVQRSGSTKSYILLFKEIDFTTRNLKFKIIWLEVNSIYFTFLLPLPYYREVMEVLFSVKIFDIEYKPDLYVLRSPQSKKVVFGNLSVRLYACVWL